MRAMLRAESLRLRGSSLDGLSPHDKVVKRKCRALKDTLTDFLVAAGCDESIANSVFFLGAKTAIRGEPAELRHE